MKKHLSIIILLCAALLLSSCNSYYISKYDHIDLDDVERVCVTIPINENDSLELTAEETEKLLVLYNSAEKVKDRKAGDTTPEFGIDIHLKTGKTISILAFPFCGHNLEVQHGKYEHRFFINSNELADYIESLCLPEA